MRAAVIYRDADLIALNKPPGLPVQGGSRVARHLDGLLGALRFDVAETPRLVHRLDRDTSGVLLLARHAAAARDLTKLFRSRSLRKLYWALVVGVPKPAQGRIDAPLAKRQVGDGERVVATAEGGQRAITDYALIESAPGGASPGSRSCRAQAAPTSFGRTPRRSSVIPSWATASTVARRRSPLASSRACTSTPARWSLPRPWEQAAARAHRAAAAAHGCRVALPRFRSDPCRRRLRAFRGRAVNAAKPKRFYKAAEAVVADGGHGIALDGKPVRTPASRPLAVSGAALANAVAEEWAAQGETIDRETMPLTRLVCTALDLVPERRADIVAEIAAYAETDLVCYRTDEPPALAHRQAAAWEPLVAWADERYGAHLAVTTSITPPRPSAEGARSPAELRSRARTISP